jgi:hypothetical protein
MNTNFCIELSDDSAQNISGGYYFGDPVNTSITENLRITKYLTSCVDVKGHFAGSEAEAFADGPGSSTQSITLTATDPTGSVSKATSVSASSGSRMSIIRR